MTKSDRGTIGGAHNSTTLTMTIRLHHCPTSPSRFRTPEVGWGDARRQGNDVDEALSRTLCWGCWESGSRGARDPRPVIAGGADEGREKMQNNKNTTGNVNAKKGVHAYIGRHRLVDRTPPMRNRVSKQYSNMPTRETQGGCAMPWECSATYQISFSDVGSWTIRLSSGDRPVFLPE